MPVGIGSRVGFSEEGETFEARLLRILPILGGLEN